MPFDLIGYRPDPPPPWRSTPMQSTRRHELLLLIGFVVAWLLMLVLVLFPVPLILASDMVHYLALL